MASWIDGVGGVRAHAAATAGQQKPAHTGAMNATGATWWLPWLVLIPWVAVWGYSLIDFSRTDERDLRTFSKDVWLVLLVFGSVVGGVAWLVAGRPRPPGVRRRA